MELSSPVDALGLSAKKAAALRRAGVETVEDLLYRFPLRYEDARPADPAALRADGPAAFYGVVTGMPVLKFFSPGKSRLAVRLDVGGRPLTAVWFNQPYLKARLAPGTAVWVYGPYDVRRRTVVAQRTEIAPARPPDGVVPVYPATEGVRPKEYRALVEAALGRDDLEVPEVLPPPIVRRYRFPDRRAALRLVHLPASPDDVARGKRRLIYEELFLFQLKLALLRGLRRRRATGVAKPVDEGRLRRAIEALPFRLTGAQARALREIVADLRSPEAMYRLLQGDVGSGKTVVAALALYAVVTAGFQGALMVPTEVLAMQHARTLRKLLPLDAELALLTGRTPPAARERILERLRDGRLDVVVGTHALIQEDIAFRRLGLAVVDEQHRFGVAERRMLLEKGEGTDILLMTATPIPRTLALAYFGDLDVSTIDELPKGRGEVETLWTTPARFGAVLDFMRRELQAGRQAYVIAPLIEASEKVDFENALALYERLRTALSEFRVGLLHGRLPGKEKDAVMQAFVRGELDVLVATTVVEVGVDVPNATVMVIVDAERFGLSQLHQLRGRVGRGAAKSTCILVSDARTEIARERLRTLVETRDGFLLAEKDLELRGPGDLFGVRQSGLPEFRLADLTSPYDRTVLAYAHRDARAVADALLEARSAGRPPAYEGEPLPAALLRLADDVLRRPVALD
ncbi:MAG: ATP-dependent DNA helicase RecG [Hydrogenibacillus schlegelii]|uniref:ATP-dependent DNA helicase RecG n=1 Tax=Hydrogenibacillus schlegelii TaxID=1484 RepID=A0A947CZT3_HYDSH|nr:ATP-dependent DNA helicase RecG [Hydrogenibacillus schlegelii]